MALTIEKYLIKEVRQLESRKPILNMRVEGMESSMQLDEEDLHTLFGVFGDIKMLQVLPDCRARVEFHFLLNAFMARQQLNGKFVKSINALLEVEWQIEEGET